MKSCDTVNNNIHVNINIDGLPLAKSSNSQLWPILGEIQNHTFKDPFLIGAYHGYKKPRNANEFLQKFYDEYVILHNEGFLFKNKRYYVTIRAIICDTPAKSFITGIKGHNAYFGCGKCFCEGIYYNHKIVFLEEDVTLRTDHNFRNRQNPEHHINTSLLESLPIDMVKHFPLDYMHLVCLGVMKKMLLLWTKGKQTFRLRNRDIITLSTDLINLKKFIPVEFSRRPRGLNEVDRWKATEFRNFLLYFGPIILQKYLNKDCLKHFCTLHTAIRILCYPKDCLNNNANSLLIFFVKNFKILYGEDNIVFNVHNLIHLCEDVKTYGSLDSFSAFPFENKMKDLKRMLRKSEKPLSQLNNRLNERSARYLTNYKSNSDTNTPILQKPDNKSLPLGCAHSYKQIQFDRFKLTLKPSDNCCFLKDGSVFSIKYIGMKDEIPVVLGRKYLDLQPIPIYPCNSQDMNIHRTSRHTHLDIIPVKEINTKAFRIIFDNVHYVMPLLHL
ncbi:hypothetical protein ALC62_04487 [Cyphomyrmex costatus]|uniref:DUF4218 domain-containing protein n=1 Tax=Cyphomyrmex costatus TaxID=456900 RepID=A0A151IK60_9HYME|nr:hypothetical protein ALC62_04487 [Cyphomyrmex costatus]